MRTLKKTLAIVLAAIMALSMCGVAFANTENYTQLPKKSDDLAPGAIWFDAAKLADDKNESNYKYNCDYYISEDGETLKITNSSITVYDPDTGAPENTVTYYTRTENPEMFEYIRELAPFVQLPDSEEGLGDGAYWFDRAGLLEALMAQLDAALYNDQQNIERYRQYYNSALQDYEQYAQENPEDAEGIEALRQKVEDYAGYIARYEQEIENMSAYQSAYTDMIQNAEFSLSEDAYVVRMAGTLTMEYEGQPVQQEMNEDDTRYANNMLWGFLRQVGVDPNEGFTLLPTADSDDLEYGAYWFDREGFIDLFSDAGIYYSTAKFYISDDGKTLRIIIFGQIEEYGRSDEDNEIFFSFLRQHGIDPYEGYMLLPQADSDELEDGDWYFDLDAFLEMIDADETTAQLYRSYSYYLSEDTETLLFATNFGDQTYTRDSLFFSFVKQHGVDPYADFIALPVVTEGDDLDEILPYGGWYFDFESYFDAYLAAEFEEGELTEEEIASEYSELLAYVTEVTVYYNPETQEVAQGYEGMITIMTTDLVGEEFYNAILSSVKFYDPWINVKLTTDGLEAGDYWLDVVNYVGNEEWVDYFFDFVQKVDILPELAAIRLTELAEFDGTVEEIITIYTPEGDFAQQYAQMAPHIYRTFAHSKASTCIEAGYENAVAITKDNETVILVPGTELGLAQHTPGEAVKENDVLSTCKELGGYDMVTYCTVCEEPIATQHVDYTELAAHTPGSAVKENESAATCTAAGGYDEVVYCTVCEDVISSTHKTINATGHTWGGWTVTTPATETAKGVETRECSVCHAKETRDIAPTGTGDNGGNNGGNTDSGDNLCKWCGKDHSGNFWQRIVGFFHKILYFFAHLFGRR